ncbi:hypothetical protein [Streptosporangium vulgare]|uniref:hypothetical protein n=1 Tax=Streptosporangium vulgare TaxID=46190 RepID=UPI0031DAA125
MILFPGTDAEAAALAGAGSTRGLAAMATRDRVIVLPSGYARLTETGRDVVITHELAHVATGATRGGRVPMWLSEGFADYAGYRDARDRGAHGRRRAGRRGALGRPARPAPPARPTSPPARRGSRRRTRRRGSPAGSSRSASGRRPW